MERERALIEEFAALVKASIEPVVPPAGFEWNSSGLGYHRDQDELSALFEAEPIPFAWVMPSLGAHFPNGWPCIDLWIRFYVGLRKHRGQPGRPRRRGMASREGTRLIGGDAEQTHGPSSRHPLSLGRIEGHALDGSVIRPKRPDPRLLNRQRHGLAEKP